MNREILDDLFILPDCDAARARVRFTAPPGAERCVWQVRDGRATVAEGSLALEAGMACAFDAAFETIRLWSPTDPHLYTLRLVLEGDAGTRTVEEDFGMRTIEVRADRLHVNGEPFLVRGWIRGREAHDHPNLAGLELEEFYAKQIRAGKDYGFNFIRFHSRIPPDECFRAADRLGIFLHVEIRKYFGHYQKERKGMNDEGEIVDEADWRSEIQRIRNHPSLMVYCLGNEIRHPGTNPRVEYLGNIARELDPTRLFLDTCAHGEFDRTYVDFDVQHMSYYYPFGKTHEMFENTYNWRIYGSCKGTPLVEGGAGRQQGAWRIDRSLPVKRPVLAHEICHYIAWRDLDALEAKFVAAGTEKPWWIDELRKLIKLKKVGRDLPKCIEASRRFQFLGWKLGIEAARRSPLLSGFHFLQLCDTERYENGNGLLDCFDEKKGVDEEAFLRFNGETVLLADLPRRTFFEGEHLSVPVLLSHYSPTLAGAATLRFRLRKRGAKTALLSGSMGEYSLDERGLREICRLELDLPKTARAQALELEVELRADAGETISNVWHLWLYPDRPETLAAGKATIALDGIDPTRRYPQLANAGSLRTPEKLLITDRFTSGVFKQLEAGRDVLMLYRVPETRDRRDPRAERETYCLPAVWDRLKGIIWDRGHNCGAFLRPSKAWAGFPHDGFLDLQFHGLVDDCDKINLDDFPVEVKPLMQGVDRAVRDRYDVHTYGLGELQPDWTLRKFAYLLELKVGKGRLLVSGFNFTGLGRDVPETCALFESLLGYVRSDAFAPKAEIAPDELKRYLRRKGREPRLRERKMTQYWQLDAEPLESAQYWKESEFYIEGKGPWAGLSVRST